MHVLSSQHISSVQAIPKKKPEEEFVFTKSTGFLDP
jgi:hypothetical protein